MEVDVKKLLALITEYAILSDAYEKKIPEEDIEEHAIKWQFNKEKHKEFFDNYFGRFGLTWSQDAVREWFIFMKGDSGEKDILVRYGDDRTES